MATIVSYDYIASMCRLAYESSTPRTILVNLTSECRVRTVRFASASVTGI